MDIGDQSLLIIGKAPLRGLAGHVYGRVPGTAFVGVVHIPAHPVIRGEEVHVLSGKYLSGMIEGGQRIFAEVFWIVEELHIVSVDQIFKLFLQIADNDGDILDTHFMELLDLPFDHALPIDLQEPFGGLKGEGDEAGAEAGGDKDRTVHAVGFQKFQAD